jgi:hypothetical protein
MFQFLLRISTNSHVDGPFGAKLRFCQCRDADAEAVLCKALLQFFLPIHHVSIEDSRML